MTTSLPLFPRNKNPDLDELAKKEVMKLMDWYFNVAYAKYVDFDNYGGLESFGLPPDVEVWDLSIRIVDMYYAIRVVYWDGMFDNFDPVKGPESIFKGTRMLEKFSSGPEDPAACQGAPRDGKWKKHPPGSFSCNKCLLEVGGRRPTSPNPFDSCEAFLFNSLRQPVKYALNRFIWVYPKDAPPLPLKIAKALKKSDILDTPYSEIMNVPLLFKELEDQVREEEERKGGKGKGKGKMRAKAKKMQVPEGKKMKKMLVPEGTTDSEEDENLLDIDPCIDVFKESANCSRDCEEEGGSDINACYAACEKLSIDCVKEHPAPKNKISADERGRRLVNSDKSWGRTSLVLHNGNEGFVGKLAV